MLYIFNRSSDRGITNTTTSCDHCLDVDVLDEEEGGRDEIATRSEVRQLHKTMVLNQWRIAREAREELALPPPPPPPISQENVTRVHYSNYFLLREICCQDR